MTDDVIPLNKIGKIGTVKVYNQAYVDKQQKRIEELEITNKKISDECHKLVDSLEKKQKVIAELQHKIDILQGYLDRDVEYQELQKENAEAKNLIEELASSLSVVGECDEEECELIDKAQKFINKPIF